MSEPSTKKEIIVNNNNINNSKSWVYSLPFFSELLKRMKIILLLHLTSKNKLIKLIQTQRLEAIKKIIRAYKNYKLINKIKKEFVVRKILAERKKAIIKIQNNFKQYLRRLKLKTILKKENKCYTIICCNKTNVTKVSVKIFIDYQDTNKTMILPMQYCPLRKYFVLQIPKTKFVLADQNNKIVRFNFLYKGNIFFDEEQYSIVDFKGKRVHEINFSQFDERKCQLINKMNLNENTLVFTKQKSHYIKKESLLSFSSDDDNEKNGLRKKSKDSNGNIKPKFERNKKKGKTCKLKNSNFLKIISILKDSQIERQKRRRRCTLNPERHVQFGTVTFSY